MAADRPEETPRFAAPPARDSRESPSLARRVWTWTTNSLLCALVLVIGLGFGREVLHWWANGGKEEQKPALLVPADGLGEPGRPHELRFGDAAWQMDAQTVVGQQRQVMIALEASCWQAAVHSPLPADGPDLAEQAFLRHLAQRPPTRSEAGVCEVHQLEGAYPMTVALRPTSKASVAGSGFRVVTWGLAVPRGTPGREWTLYTFHPAGPARAAVADLPEIPLPPGGQRLLSMQVAGGGAMVTFQGVAQVGAWKQFFDRWFSSHGWRPATGWRAAGSSWHVRYGPAAGDAGASADVQFSPDSRGGLTGLVVLSPPPRETATNK